MTKIDDQFDIRVLDPDFDRIRAALDRRPYVLFDTGDGQPHLAVTTRARQEHADGMIRLLAYLLDDATRTYLDPVLVRVAWPWTQALGDDDAHDRLEQLVPLLRRWEQDPDAVGEFLERWQADARAAEVSQGPTGK